MRFEVVGIQRFGYRIWIYETACSKIVKLEDSISATARAVRRTILNGESAHVPLDLLERLRIHLIGIFYTEVGLEWSSCGKQEGDSIIASLRFLDDQICDSHVVR